MSTFEAQALPCPLCGTVVEQSVAVSINAARRPAFRDEVIAGAFHRFRCAACDAAYLHETTFTYLDFERGQFLFVCPTAERGAWRVSCEAATTIFARNLGGPDAPPAARALGARMSLRVCFGLDAFREKVLCAEHGIDDELLELGKLRLLALSPLAHAPGAALRLDEVVGDELRLSWRDLTRQQLIAPWAALGQARTAESEALLARLRASPWVDAQRLLMH